MSSVASSDTAVGGFLSSLPYYAELRRQATRDGRLTRVEGSNVDVASGVNHTQHPDDNDNEPDHERLAVCHVSTIASFTLEAILPQGERVPNINAYTDTAALALALHHLNTGNGSIVPAIQGWNERCPLRFTLEAADNGFYPNRGIEHFVNQVQRRNSATITTGMNDAINVNDRPPPCAIVGSQTSANTIPLALVTGIFKYFQISPTAMSSQLDNKEQFPYFARTTPSVAGPAASVVAYFRDRLHLTHVSIVNQNDAFGNDFVDAIRQAAAVLHPALVIHQVPWDVTKPDLVTDVVESVADTGYRFVYVEVHFSQLQHLLLEEAVRQGVAGDGLHNYVFGVTFNPIDGVPYEKDSALHKAYRGLSFILVETAYTRLTEPTSRLDNPADRATLDAIYPRTMDRLTGEPIVHAFRNGSDFLTADSEGAAFSYEAGIALGLSACAALDPDTLTLTAAQHFEAFTKTAFAGISGDVRFDNVTGTRDPSGPLIMAINYRDVEGDDGQTVYFERTVTGYFQEDRFTTVAPIVFNDGTTNIPIDRAAAPDNVAENQFFAFLSLALVLVLAFFCLRKRPKNDQAMWTVLKEDLRFDEPPVVLGSGTFGLVLRAEYRGTQVAVKRVLPPNNNNNEQRKGSILTKNFDKTAVLQSGVTTASMAQTTNYSIVLGTAFHKTDKVSQRKLKEEFLEEMKQLARLRHPCITTVMGAVIDKSEDPMLVMELMEHGSLYDLLHNETMALDGDLILPILRDISQGMRFLHAADLQVLHGDLKAQNILVDKRFRAKVADFGLSQKRNLGGSGTPYWMAPELLRKESTNTSASDVFSFGVILYEMYSRKDPYEGEDFKEVIRQIVDKSICKRVPVPRGMPEILKLLMMESMDEEANKRPSFEEIDMRMKRFDEETVATEQSKEKRQVSLFDIFPRHVAEALRDGRKVEAEHRDVVTIFFSDIVGFTDISATLEPRKVADMLDRLYHKFDDLSTKHDIYKVETIGDAFMAVANLVKDQPHDHCKRIAQFSLEAIQAANQTLIDSKDPSKGHVNIRVGFHSGSVVADVVGNRNPRYCLFGDAVNTASRMESHSEKNQINCSKKAAEILSDQWPSVRMECRGELLIKGKGKMKCYWVNGLGEPGSEHDKANLFPDGSGEMKPEQHPSNPGGSERVLGVGYGSGDGSVDIENLEGNLKDRLSRNAKPDMV